MHENVYSAPQSDLNVSKSTDAEVWNPDAAGAWSLLFTPIFGSVLVYKNWQSLGEADRANKSKKWIYISVLMALLSAVLGLVGLIYIITWYFASQKPQSVFFKNRAWWCLSEKKLGETFAHRPWTMVCNSGHYLHCCWPDVCLITKVYGFCRQSKSFMPK